MSIWNYTQVPNIDSFLIQKMTINPLKMIGMAQSPTQQNAKLKTIFQSYITRQIITSTSMFHTQTWLMSFMMAAFQVGIYYFQSY